MRTIKFRAWHRTALQMLYADNAAIFRWIEHEHQPIELMQFTGLHDRNGREIYEGDITSSGYQIMWNEKKALFAEHFYQEFHQKWFIASYPISVDRIEVIGNVFENKNLLS